MSKLLKSLELNEANVETSMLPIRSKPVHFDSEKVQTCAVLAVCCWRFSWHTFRSEMSVSYHSCSVFRCVRTAFSCDTLTPFADFSDMSLHVVL